jgi:hypothetical protein
VTFFLFTIFFVPPNMPVRRQIRKVRHRVVHTPLAV